MTLTLMKTLTIITTMPQVRVEAIKLIMVRAETNNLEGLYHETEDKDLNAVNVREVHCNKIVHNMAAHASRIFRGIK